MKFSSVSIAAAVASASVPIAFASPCPLGFEVPAGAEGEGHASWVRRVQRRRLAEAEANGHTETNGIFETNGHTETNGHHVIPPAPIATAQYMELVNGLDIEAVKADLKAAMTDSKDFWPADYGNYGPFFIRLAWHCSGTFRETDGRGGCSGGRIRFEPENSWEDNTNLEKARRLLAPIKEKYGDALSWGDLYVMAGTTAIEAMGGPTLGVCVGRVDEPDGARSAGLDECVGENGDCQKPMGATTEGLIYVNPEGPQAQPIPDQSALQIRDTFSRMGMDDRETVALIGGGHSFGKTHGACDAANAAGLSPRLTAESGLDPETESYKGACGSGHSADAWTSGFEGPWTPTPTAWDNSYFTTLLAHEWSHETGPGGKQQWHSADEPLAPGAFGGTQRVMMLTSDVALLYDPEDKYQPIVREFADDQAKLDEAFAAAWHKLTTSGFGNKDARCTGAMPYVREVEKVGAEAETNGKAETDGDGASGEANEEEAKGESGAQSLVGAALPVLVAQAVAFLAL